jgi:hypothetical protein
MTPPKGGPTERRPSKNAVRNVTDPSLKRAAENPNPEVVRIVEHY